MLLHTIVACRAGYLQVNHFLLVSRLRNGRKYPLHTRFSCELSTSNLTCPIIIFFHLLCRVSGSQSLWPRAVLCVSLAIFHARPPLSSTAHWSHVLRMLFSFLLSFFCARSHFINFIEAIANDSRFLLCNFYYSLVVAGVVFDAVASFNVINKFLLKRCAAINHSKLIVFSFVYWIFFLFAWFMFGNRCWFLPTTCSTTTQWAKIPRDALTFSR